jgi:hypothetical protein
MRVIGQSPGTSTQTVATVRNGGDDPNLHLDLLTFGYAEVFIKLNRFAMDDTVDRSDHMEISCLSPKLLYLIFGRESEVGFGQVFARSAASGVKRAAHQAG